VKFSDIDKEQWPLLKPYLDTVLLPVTGLNGTEEPWEATHGLEQLRDIIDVVEDTFRGRVVIYPTYHYITEPTSHEQLQHICSNLRANGFNYVIIAIRGNTKLQLDKPYYDLLLSYSDYKGITVGEMKKDVRGKIVELWGTKRDDTNM
jgi:23S rRNA (pseudouridine1915-N3)-methyltransferase